MNTQFNTRGEYNKTPKKVNNDGTIAKELAGSAALLSLQLQLESEAHKILSDVLKDSFTNTGKATDVYITKGFYGANVNMGTYSHEDLDKAILPQLAYLLGVTLDKLENITEVQTVTKGLAVKNAKYSGSSDPDYWKKPKFIDRALIMLGNIQVEVVTKFNGKNFEHTIFIGLRIVLEEGNKQIHVKFQTHVSGFNKSKKNRYPVYGIINRDGTAEDDVECRRVINEIFANKQDLLNELIAWDTTSVFEW